MDASSQPIPATLPFAAHAGRLTWVLTLGVLTVGLACSLVAAVSVYRLQTRIAEARFGHVVDGIAAETSERIADFAAGLYGVRGLYASHGSIGRREFRAYAQSGKVDRVFKGTYGLGFIQRVPRKDVDAFVTAERTDGAPDFRVRSDAAVVTPINQPPEEPAQDLYIIKYIEPLERNCPAWGFDIGFDPVRRAAADRAMLTGEPTLSGPITLVQDGRKRERAGFLYILAVYKSGTNPITAAERRAALVGWAYTPLVIDEVMAEVEKEMVKDLVTLEVYEQTAGGGNGGKPTNADLLYDKDGVPQAVDAADNTARMFQRWIAVKVDGRDWAMWIGTQPAFEAEHDRSTAAVFTGTSGACVSGLLAAVIFGLGTGRARATALANSQRRFQAIFEQAAVGVAQVAPDGCWIDANPGLCAIVGYTREELLAKTFQDITHAEDLDAQLQQTRRALAGEISTFAMEKRYVRKDGSFIWAELTASLVREASGAPAYFISVIVDINVRKRAEQELAASERRFRSLVEGADVVVWEADPRTHTFTYVSPQAAKFGYPLEEWYTPDFWARHVHSDDRVQAVAYSRAESAAGRRHRHQYRMLTADRRTVWIEDCVSVEKAGDTGEWIERGVLMDISESKHAEERMAQSERDYRGLFEHAHDAILIFRPDGEVVLDANERACAMYGFARSEFIGMSLERISADIANGRRQVEVTLRQGSNLNFESVHYRKDGSVMPVEINAAALEYRGEPVILSINRDITWRRQAEAKLIKAERREVLAQLAGGIAHEFNSTLLAASIYLNGAQSGPIRPDPSIGKAASLIDQAQSLSASLLELFAGPESKAPPVLTTGDWLPECVHQLANVLPTGVSVTLVPIGEVKPVHADPLALEQVLRILIGNASDAIGGQGEIRVTMMSTPEEVNGEPGVEIRVIDEGPGIPEKDRDRVFEPFFTTRNRARRSGLGLAIASRLVEQAGGRLSYEANRPTGSVFVVRLRAAQRGTK